MKTKTLFIFLITTLFFSLGKSQSLTVSEYPAFYTQTVNQLNNIIPNKTNYYGQPLSSLIQALNQNNLIIKAYVPGPWDNNRLKLQFIGDAETLTNIANYNYVDPYIQIIFEQPFDFQQANVIFEQYHWFWNASAENFYKGLIVKKIEFWYVNGLTDMSNNPK